MVVPRLLICTFALTFCCCTANAFTLTFDDVPVGGDLSHYSDVYGVVFIPGFWVVDHVGSSWGPPTSGRNVLMWDGNPLYAAGVRFGNTPPDGTGNVPHYNLTSIRGCFSTQLGIQVMMVGYDHGGHPIASALIGALGQSWDRVYAEITSPAGEIDFVDFAWVNSQEERRGVCVDNVTIVPVPEPASLLALCVGLVPLVVRRRRG